jgi:hypothetical protein
MFGFHHSFVYGYILSVIVIVIVRSLFTQGDPISDCSLLSLGALKNIQYIYNTVLSKIV